MKNWSLKDFNVFSEGTLETYIFRKQERYSEFGSLM